MIVFQPVRHDEGNGHLRPGDVACVSPSAGIDGLVPGDRIGEVEMLVGKRVSGVLIGGFLSLSP